MSPDPSHDTIFISEVLSLGGGCALDEVGAVVQRALDLPAFTYAGEEAARWGTAKGDGIECHVVRHEGDVNVILFLREGCRHADDPDWSSNVLVPRVAGCLVDALGRPVRHSTTLLLNGANRTWDRAFAPSAAAPPPAEWHGARAGAAPPAEVAPAGWGPHLFVTTDRACRPDYAGSLDFAFLVHPRAADEKVRPFPEARGLPEELIASISYRKECFVISRLEVHRGTRTLRGELLTIPFTPADMLERVPQAREAIDEALAYAGRRGTRILGLGGLLPAMTRYGARLAGRFGSVGVTTGHGFTALAIADYVTQIEAARGDAGPIAVVGAAGSTGRAAVRRLIADRPERRLILHDVASRLGLIAEPAGSAPGQHRITADRASIRDAAVVVCVTNALGSILGADDFGPGCVVLDDAQPENVSYAEVKARPDLSVVKCLARVPGLRCPFDFGLFGPGAHAANQEVTFTCLAETILLAAAGHDGAFTVGDPREEQIAYLREVAPRFGIGISPFYSFPEVGPVSLTRPRAPDGAGASD